MVSRTIVLALLGALAGLAWAEELTLGYLELEDDSRYAERHVYARYLMQPWGRPYAGAETALRESRFVGSALGIEFGLSRMAGKDTNELLAAIETLTKQGTRLFLVDAPAAIVAEVAHATRNRELLLFNISAMDDELRQAQCQPHLLHLVPNYAMLMDALTQYLLSRQWRTVLVLEGPQPEDTRLAISFERAAKRFGAKIVAKRPFVLSNDPRQRDLGNVALLTAGQDYDVVFVADSDGEFARAVPYQTVRPRPVVGSEGLIATAWHWAWERHGAPQLNSRFEKQAKRPMTGFDWAAWMAVKAVVEAVLRTESTDFKTLSDYIRGEDIILDGFKGNRLSFRSWDNQLRQPLLLATHNWVVERAPLQGFLHQTNNLDTLGFDRPESDCRF